MKIGEEVYIHGFIDEIRKDTVIIRNEGGYFGTVKEELRSATEKQTNTAEWIRQTDKTKKMYGWCFCSNCNAYIGSKPNYCSSCGRKMTNAVAE